MNYFNKFALINYNNKKVINIVERVKILDIVKNDIYAFLPYTIDTDDKPEDIANLYYGSPEFIWLIFLANNIIDPYTQWPKTSDEFYNFLKLKYQTLSGQTGDAIVAWTMSTTKYYKNVVDNSIVVSADTFIYDTNIIQNEWTSVSFYEFEEIENDSLRNIFLVNKSYSDMIDNEMSRLLKNVS